MEKRNVQQSALKGQVASKKVGSLMATVGLLIMSWLAACGVKAPPVPPLQVPPPAVSDLYFRIENGWARLNWSMPKAELEEKQPQIANFLVYRSKTALEKPCEGCPLMFQNIGLVSPHNTTESAVRDTEVGYADKLSKGYRYVYKVVGVTVNNVRSADSNLIEFNYADR